MDTVGVIRQSYNDHVDWEWDRLDRHPVEFALTCRFLDRYIKPGETVLDIGGGPGRYSLRYAAKGCGVTLFDLAEENLRFAEERAAEQDVRLRTVCGDARQVDELVEGTFDHVLLMGPMYHLLEEADRIRAVEGSLRLLRPGGKLYVSFISAFAGMIYDMKFAPELLHSPLQKEIDYKNAVLAGKSYAGDSFTYAYFAQMGEIRPFFERFPLSMLHFFGQEGVTAPCEEKILASSPETVKAWIDFSEQVCEREEYLCFAEHLMYIGRKWD